MKTLDGVDLGRLMAEAWLSPGETFTIQASFVVALFESLDLDSLDPPLWQKEEAEHLRCDAIDAVRRQRCGADGHTLLHDPLNPGTVKAPKWLLMRLLAVAQGFTDAEPYSVAAMLECPPEFMRTQQREDRAKRDASPELAPMDTTPVSVTSIRRSMNSQDLRAQITDLYRNYRFEVKLKDSTVLVPLDPTWGLTELLESANSGTLDGTKICRAIRDKATEMLVEDGKILSTAEVNGMLCASRAQYDLSMALGVPIFRSTHQADPVADDDSMTAWIDKAADDFFIHKASGKSLEMWCQTFGIHLDEPNANGRVYTREAVKAAIEAFKIPPALMGSEQSNSKANAEAEYRAFFGLPAGESMGAVAGAYAKDDKPEDVGACLLKPEDFVDRPSMRARYAKAKLDPSLYGTVSIDLGSGDVTRTQFCEAKDGEVVVDYAVTLPKTADDMIKLIGKWVGPDYDPRTHLEPQAFKGNYFMVATEVASDDMAAAGAILQADHWDDDNMPCFRVIHGLSNEPGGHVFIRVQDVTLIGVEWNPAWRSLSYEVFDALTPEEDQSAYSYVFDTNQDGSKTTRKKLHEEKDDTEQ